MAAVQSRWIDPQRVEEAHRAIDRRFKSTPQFVSDALSELTGSTILCKDETRNPIGSFKGRGASWWMICHPDVKHVVCVSAGNFGQGMAHAGRQAGCEVHVFVSRKANPAKVEAMRQLDARVHEIGATFDEAKKAASALADENGWRFVVDGLEPEITEGAGTIGLELCRSKLTIDKIYVQLGDGALAAGVGSYVKAKSPSTRIVAVAAEGAPAMAKSWKARKIVASGPTDTVADGIAVETPIPEALSSLLPAIDDAILVSDRQIKATMQLLFKLEGVVAEPAGAAALAAVLSRAERDRGKRIGVVISGSNIDPRLRELWLGI